MFLLVHFVMKVPCLLGAQRTSRAERLDVPRLALLSKMNMTRQFSMPDSSKNVPIPPLPA